MIIWITGISGSGKTTIANEIIRKYKKYLPNLINIDGDIVRHFFGEQSPGYEEKHRVSQIKRIQKICKFLEQQKLILIVSALYCNNQLMKWNRENFSNYYEIFLDADLSLVKKRDPKNLYKKYQEGKEKNIVGIDISWHPPQKYDLRIIMNEKTELKDVIKHISSKLNIFRNLGN